jgi:hypothetical protein
MPCRIRIYECDSRGREIPGSSYVAPTRFPTAAQATAVIECMTGVLAKGGCRPDAQRFEVVEAAAA